MPVLVPNHPQITQIVADFPNLCESGPRASADHFMSESGVACSASISLNSQLCLPLVTHH